MRRLQTSYTVKSNEGKLRVHHALVLTEAERGKLEWLAVSNQKGIIIRIYSTDNKIFAFQ